MASAKIPTGGQSISSHFCFSSGSASSFFSALMRWSSAKRSPELRKLISNSRLEVNFQLKIPLQEWVAALNLPFTAVALIILALLLYLLTPENYLTLRQALPGAIFFAVGWIIATKLFQIYVARYDRYNPTYLALASIIVLLTWMYLTCLLLLVGGKLNAILRRELARETTQRGTAPAPPPA
ncbi:MAG: hypothetical protein DME81_02490 [Verrucomicrobia bacterium]|nr:MAG: hypothetical protein DME81_02490 [Verrucomicrobiota bacterium]